MILLVRALSRAVAFVLLLALAVACLAAAIFSVPSGANGLVKLGELTQTQRAADESGRFIRRLERGDTHADAATAAGLAGLIGVVLVAGAVIPRRERTLPLDGGDDGRIVARRRPLQAAASALAGRGAGITRVRARVRGRYRRAGGQLRVKVGRGPGAEPEPTRAQVADRVQVLAGPFGLKAKIRTRRDEKRRAVR